MGLTLRLTTISELLAWIIHGHVHYAFVIGYLMEHGGVTYKKCFDDQVSKSSQSQISDYALMKCVLLIAGVHPYL